MAAFIARCKVILNAKIDEETASFKAAREKETNDFDEAAEEDGETFSEFKADQLERLDEWIADRIAEADAELERVKEDYFEDFIKTLFEVYQDTPRYQRVLLLHKAKKLREGYFNQLDDVRLLLGRGLRNTRGNLVNQNEEEWNRLERAQGEDRYDLIQAGKALAMDIAEAADAANESCDAHGDEVMDGLNERFLKQGHDVEQLVSGINGYTFHYPFIGKTNPAPKTQIYGYAGHSQNRINAIDVMVDDFSTDIFDDYQ